MAQAVNPDFADPVKERSLRRAAVVNARIAELEQQQDPGGQHA
jgi:hypothetical protein